MSGGAYDRNLVEHVPDGSDAPEPLPFEVRVVAGRKVAELRLPADRFGELVAAVLDHGCAIDSVRVRVLLPDQAPADLLCARDVAALVGRSLPWVYKYAERLGGFRTKPGRGRWVPWRWRLDDVLEAYDPDGQGWDKWAR